MSLSSKQKRIRSLVPALLLCLLVPLACAPRATGRVPSAVLNVATGTRAAAPTAPVVGGPLESVAAATVLGRGLRLRSLPNVGAEIVTSLAVGDRLGVASRTSWIDTIDGRVAPWYEVSKGWAAGWCFGGYLSLPESTEIPESTIERGTLIPSHSWFRGADGSMVDALPYLDMKIFGIEAPNDIPSRDGFGAVIDTLHNRVFVTMTPAPERSLHVDARDPGGETFSSDLSLNGHPGFTLYSVNEQGYTYASPVIGFQFHPPANSHAGNWILTVIPDDRRAARRTYTVSARTATATLSADPRPNPFQYPSSVLARPGDTLSLFGVDGPQRSKLTISLYHITDVQNEDLSFKLKPSVAGEIQVDASGRWRTTLKVGMDLRPGAYKLATGAHPPALNLFEVYLEIE